MAVAPTGAIYKALKFDNVSSRTYGVYITGEAVYNAPKRDVEMITIPGRSGSFALDNGRFENIEVSYPAGIYADTEADFRQAISDFRNFLCSRKGYVRLQDEYNPDEYRMAVYKSGLDVDPALLRAGEFTITFDCKPQRWLTSGETAITVTSGDTLTNPTLFESGPLLEATGYGVIGFNGYETLLEQKPIGNLVLDGPKNYSVNIPVGQGASPINLNATITVDTSALNTGDPINFMGTKASWTIDLDQWHGTKTFDYVTLLNETGISATTNIVVNPTKATVTTSFPPIPFAFGTASTATHMTQFEYSYDSGHITGGAPQDVTITYDGAQTFTIFVEGDPPSGTQSMTVTFATSEIDAYSSVIVTDPVFIDCDTGEAYSVVDGMVVDANSFVTLGSDLPKLGVGSNTVTFDNTITQLKITPRWWKV